MPESLFIYRRRSCETRCDPNVHVESNDMSVLFCDNFMFIVPPSFNSNKLSIQLLAVSVNLILITFFARGLWSISCHPPQYQTLNFNEVAQKKRYFYFKNFSCFR